MAIPDPTIDLDWSGFVGAIQDVFSANAQRHPDRLCVVETPSQDGPQREFSYRVIDEASNALAHYLVDSGVERGDVVMIYAYRGVDLVVAVMGTLKAGGTFSVIDPLYPPERQKIYLEVAQPKALVNIAKATVEAGELSHLVRSYIDESLALKAEVPALRIRDNGSIDGGEKDGKDIFEGVRSKVSKSPGVLVGPDSNPTLSFTSGSEGRPKGVLGRHFSLAYYFPWMKERFVLSEDDKFTMLSGIAHDPIQRDIFTPLFLGAHILVPAKEDIQHERLAEWMRHYGATITHLTPAMGQILVGGASAEFSALRRAFFVGDVLTKRDCNLLRTLAPNVNIVNMYGTTETQRAVSYFEIPNRIDNATFLDGMKEIIPAGRGMHNVQLLVVNRKDKTKQCQVDEVGEIYVRACGLAEGYLGDNGLNEQKFVKNWFVDNRVWVEADEKHSKDESWRQFYKGPRDRLYRTGDLGRYLPSGDVECSGRADDQVKIRGFRIELGDINSHLSQHILVRDSVTLLKRDKVEEPTLVSYIVPEFNRWSPWLEDRGMQDHDEGDSMVNMLRRFRPLQNELRDHLKGKLPSYAVPTHFIPLTKLPLNPNGKVDKPALPFPDIVEITAVASEESLEAWGHLSETEQMVASLWAELIPGSNAKSIRPDDAFFDIGGHSISAQHMLLNTSRRIGKKSIPMSTIYQQPTLRGFASALDGLTWLPNGLASPTFINGATPKTSEYSKDAETLVKTLPSSFPSAPTFKTSSPPSQLTAFLTGATGFLGAFLLRDLLSRNVKVIAHVRSKSAQDGFERIKNSCEAYGIWQKDWASLLTCATGDLYEPQLGLRADDRERIVRDADVVIHNGAQVHWVSPYSKLRSTNVLATLDALRLCAEGKPKHFAFVSSTSVLDNEHYVKISQESLNHGGTGVLESDDLEGSRTGLGTGYGQSKWASEYLVREAGRRGLKGTIVRPGYILGDSQTGVTNTDDFLIRLLKGCIQIRSRPQINNTVNMVPVDHVARVVAACAFHPPQSPISVAQVTSHPRMRMTEYLSSLEYYGYSIPQAPYASWSDDLERYVSEGVQKDYEQHALMPLYHFVTNDLPANTRASELDDTNAAAALRADAEWTGVDESTGSAVTRELVGKYIKYLTLVGFLPEPPPDSKGRPLPKLELTEAQKAVGRNVGGRGKAVAP